MQGFISKRTHTEISQSPKKIIVAILVNIVVPEAH